jgi:diaminopropionate ammonia-lyase
MQGYTVMVREALRQLSEPPTDVFVQAGVGGGAAAVAGHLALALGDQRPRFVVVEPREPRASMKARASGVRSKSNKANPP